MKRLIVEQVAELGTIEDWYAILNLYGIEGVKEEIKKINYLSNRSMNFASIVFDIPLNEMKCYIKKQLQPELFIS